MINDVEYVIINCVLAFFVIGCVLDRASAVAVIGFFVFCCRYFRLEPVSDERLIDLGFIPVTSLDRQKSGDGIQTKTFVIAHRGAGAEAPENTIEAIKQAAKRGADGVEVDLEFTKDGVAVLLHDDTVDRTTDGTGRIDNLTYMEVLTLNASAKHPHRDKFKVTRIPTLEECVKVCLQLKMRLFIDCKRLDSKKKTCDVLLSMFKKYPDLHNLAVVCSFYPNVIYSMRKRDLKIITALTHRHRLLSLRVDGSNGINDKLKSLIAPILDTILEWSQKTWVWYLCGNSFFLCHKANINQHLVDRFSGRGIRVVAWTVNNPEEKVYFGHILNCYLITDSMDPNYIEKTTI